MNVLEDRDLLRVLVLTLGTPNLLPFRSVCKQWLEVFRIEYRQSSGFRDEYATTHCCKNTIRILGYSRSIQLMIERNFNDETLLKYYLSCIQFKVDPDDLPSTLIAAIRCKRLSLVQLLIGARAIRIGEQAHNALRLHCYDSLMKEVARTKCDAITKYFVTNIKLSGGRHLYGKDLVQAYHTLAAQYDYPYILELLKAEHSEHEIDIDKHAITAAHNSSIDYLRALDSSLSISESTRAIMERIAKFREDTALLEFLEEIR